MTTSQQIEPGSLVSANGDFSLFEWDYSGISMKAVRKGEACIVVAMRFTPFSGNHEQLDRNVLVSYDKIKISGITGSWRLFVLTPAGDTGWITQTKNIKVL